MKTATLNFVIDAVAFAAFVLLASTGILVRYVLPAGSGRFRALWGMDRHEWGQWHFWIAVALMSALALHLLLHWRWIACMVRGRPREGSGVRVALAIVGLAGLVALAVSPFLGEVERTGEPPYRMRGTGAAWDTAWRVDPAPSPAPSAPRDSANGPAIDGSMTLADIERLTGVPAAVILRELGLPADVPADERLGRLRRQYGFEMQDVREIVRRRSPTPGR